MPLTPGSHLGPYEVLSSIGAGGMGEVYRARDSRLNRTVAIKVLPEHLSSSPDFRERFEREARSISALQHPNICVLHDIGRQDGIDYLVLEYVEGESLEQRLSKGPLPVDQVLRYGSEIAGALDKAHRQGIVHRDLKPGNIMLTRTGAKLLDFGLAKLKPESTALNAPGNDVTVATQKLTAEGTLVGTFQYMAPEQLEGKEADARTDIFSLGTVIYEMITGRAAFTGQSRASLIAAIISSEPPSISTLQPMTPPALDRVVKRCLAKDPDDRWQSAGDLASELKWIAESGSQAGIPAPVKAQQKSRQLWLWTAVAVLSLLAAAAGFLYWRSARQSPSSVQAYLPPPDNTNYFFSGDVAGFPVISAQGDKVAFVATDDHGSRLIWVRSLVDGSVQSLSGTEAAAFPFWSPDGKSLAYFAGAKIKRISLSGGSPIDVTDAPNPRGGSWGAGDIIVFTPDTQTGIFAVPATGGTAHEITKVDQARHTTHRWPFFLPDGKRFLYMAASHARPHSDLDEIFVASIDGKENRRLTGATSNGIAVPGYLLFVQGSSLMAQPFDISSASLRGEPVPVAANVHFEEGNWRAVFDCSADGTLLYQSVTGSQGSQLLWYGRDGRLLGKLGDLDRYEEVSLSPDGRYAAVAAGDPASNLWVYDLARGLRTRYTFSTNSSRYPVWSPDGSQIAFERGTNEIYVVGANDAGSEKPFYTSPSLKRPNSWSPDGKFLFITESTLGIGVSLLNTSGDKQAQEFISRKLNSMDAQFSPDGHWVVYTSQESGRSEVFVTQFPQPKGKWQISTDGGREPRWRSDGKGIFYWAWDHNIMEAQVEHSGDQFRVNALHPLFKVTMPVYPFGGVTWDVTRDGQRFLVNASPSTGEQPLTVVTNWTARMKK